MRHPAAQHAHALPRVLAKKADADVEDRAADKVDGFESARSSLGATSAIMAVVIRVAHRHWCASRSVTLTS